MPEPIPLKDHDSEKRLVNKRLIACAALVLAISCALIGRMYFLQVTEFDYNSEDRRDHPVDKGPDPYDNLDDPSNCTKAVTDCLS